MPDSESGRAGVLRGAGVSPGVGVGPVRSVAGAVPEPPAGSRHGGDAAAERDAALAALEEVAADLEARGARAAERGNTAGRDVLNAQALMARDPGLADGVRARIEEGTAAARAVFEAFGVYREMLAGAGEYMAARVSDLDDVRDRAVARLLGLPMPGVPESDEPFVLVARDLAPADTAVLDPAKVVAFVTEEGGPTSHTAILARTMGVPAVVALPGATSLADGTRVLVDGAAGTVRPEPADAEVAGGPRRCRRPRRRAGGLHRAGRHRRTATRCRCWRTSAARRISRRRWRTARRASGCTAPSSCSSTATAPPSDDEQEEAYRRVLEAFPGARGRPDPRRGRRQAAGVPPAARRGAEPGARRARPADDAPPPRGPGRPSSPPWPAPPPG